VSRGAALTDALLVTVATPATWPMALAAFLLRGGIVLVTLPIVVLPTPVGLGNVVAPAITSVALGTIPILVLVVSVIAAAVASGWLLLGGWVAAALEGEGVRIVARDEEATAARGPASTAVPPIGGGDATGASRILAARLVAYLPLGLALAWASVRFVSASYAELTNPSDVSTPIVLRVVRASPDAVLAIALAWMVGEIVGAMAARRIVLRGDPVMAALRGAVVDAFRHPLAVLARFWLPTLVLALVLAPSALAAASAWTAASAALLDRADPLQVVAAIVLFVVSWVVGLILAGVVCAWRAAAWTVADLVGPGTFGGSSDRRPGDWRPDGSSANL
jgi:hypothetical protein